MDKPITVQLIAGDDETQQFSVTIGTRKYEVTVPLQYHQRLTNGTISTEELVKRSFEFLLEREPASSILPEFELPLINRYFPDYEETLSKQL